MTDDDWIKRTKKSAATMEKNKTVKPRPQTTWKQQWETIAGVDIFFRSQWEVDYAKYLQFLKENGNIAEWKYECKTFWFDKIKRGCVSYKPDFKVIENSGEHSWHEVKGWMDNNSKTKLKRMKKYYPKEKIVLIREPQIKEIRKKFSFLLGS
jgi:hypothetical protein